ncbi:MAG: hypothetical protein E7671_00755 [Ruminococcaceae bacterium]|nr:hypothetical protein [Oscillospiraceae bacterium]
MFKLDVKKSIIKVNEREPIVTGASKVYKVHFLFSEEWEGLVKTAVFKAGDVSVSVLANEGHCIIPFEVLAPENAGKVLWAGAFGSDEDGIKLPTEWNMLGVINEGAEPFDKGKEPSPSVIAQIYGVAKKAGEAAEEAKKSADTAEAILSDYESVSDELKYGVENAHKRIKNLEHQVAPEYFETDETVAYEKAVPANACPYAELQSVGGMTHRSNNLIPFPYDVASGSMVGGLPLTIDGGVITVGTGTAVGGFANLCHSLTLPAGTYTLSGMPKGSGLMPLYLSDNTGDHSFSDNGDGCTFTLPGTVTFTQLKIAALTGVAIETPITIKPMLNVGSTALPFEPYFEGLADTPVTAIVSKDAEGNILSSIEMPEAVRKLDGYGMGINKYANTVDFEALKYLKNVGIVEFTGSESWEKYPVSSYPEGIYCYQHKMPEKLIGYQTSFCSHFINEDGVFARTKAKLGYYSDHDSLNRVYFISDKPTVTEWEAWLAENPVMLVYALADPVEEDISDKLGDIDNLIEVAPSGKIVFENEDGRAVHSSVTYMLEEGTV